MQIVPITTQAKFDAEWHTLAVWTYGPLSHLPRDRNDDDCEQDEDHLVLLAVIGGETVGYLSADAAGIWCIEVHPAYRARGIARALVEASGADAFCEVCSADGAALAAALNMEVI